MSDVQHAASCLLSGGVIAHATEGVWGFACDPNSDSAIERILKIKGRKADKGMLLLADSATVFEPALNRVSLEVRQRVIDSWPGHITWLLPGEAYPVLIRGSHRTVACRVPDHEQARHICSAFGNAIVSTSLNRTGGSPIVEFSDALRQFEGDVDFIVPGQTSGYLGPSQIRGLDGSMIRSALT